MPQGSIFERGFKHILEENGFFVVRSAGSLAVDLVAIRKVDGVHKTFLIEVKSFKTKRFYPSKTKETKEQWAEMKRLEGRFWKDDQTTVHVYYALHKKNRSWAMALPSSLDLPNLHCNLVKWLRNIRKGMR